MKQVYNLKIFANIDIFSRIEMFIFHTSFLFTLVLRIFICRNTPCDKESLCRIRSIRTHARTKKSALQLRFFLIHNLRYLDQNLSSLAFKIIFYLSIIKMNNSETLSSNSKQYITALDLLRPHKCQQCDGRFRRDYELTRHINMVHEGEKPHVCDLCGEGFARKSSMNRHIKACNKDSIDKIGEFQYNDHSPITLKTSPPRDSMLILASSPPYHQSRKSSSPSQPASGQIPIRLRILEAMNHIRESKNEGENTNAIKLVCDAGKDRGLWGWVRL